MAKEWYAVFDPNPWRRLRRIAWYSLVSYFVLVWLVAIRMLFAGGEFGGFVRLVPAATSPVTATGDLSGQVRNVLGDPVPGAQVRLADLIVSTDAKGMYYLEGVPIGQHVLELSAPGYQTTRLFVQVEAGKNQTPITSDTGLWPERLLVSFHLFTNPGENGEDVLYGLLGMANGLEQSVYVRKVALFDPSGNLIYDLVTHEDARRQFLLPMEEIAMQGFTEEYLVVPGHIVFENELPLLPPPQFGVYSLSVAYGLQPDFSLEEAYILQLSEEPEADPDWNPRFP